MLTGQWVSLTTDQHKPYLTAVESAFGLEFDYAVLHKIYGAPSDDEMRRYSPAKCIGCEAKPIIGKPDPAHVSTSYVERARSRIVKQENALPFAGRAFLEIRIVGLLNSRSSQLRRFLGCTSIASDLFRINYVPLARLSFALYHPYRVICHLFELINSHVS